MQPVVTAIDRTRPCSSERLVARGPIEKRRIARPSTANRVDRVLAEASSDGLDGRES